MPTLTAIRASNAAWQPSYTPVGIFVGGTSGIGEGTVDAFARHTNGNAHIILVGRNRAAATSILARVPKPSTPGRECTREFLPCDLSLIANAKRAAAALAARFPRGVNFVFLSAGAISLSGLDLTEENVDRQMAALYYSKWALIDGLLPALRAARAAGEDARVAAIHTAGRGGPIDLADLGLMKARGAGGLASVQKVFRDVFPQLASYQDLMAEGFAAHSPHAHIHPCLPRHGGQHAPFARIALPAPPHPALPFVPDASLARDGNRRVRGSAVAPAGASRTGSTGDDIGLGGDDDAWAQAREALWAHSAEVVAGWGS
ncbi:hypothetical protein MVEN_00459600 [Mycena venus]|uniref:NAD(P)-binding protein n=1 Tax=Mycena venus TaxID=2733690 RepID=A0A8H6YV83_9AGAR|nr:hypothetical protein MVEN_00459600 [Mycena venus]